MAKRVSPSPSWQLGTRSHPASPNHYTMPASSNPSSPNHLYGSQHNGPTVLGDSSILHYVVLIGMDGSKDPSETCLLWALKNLIRPGDSVTVLGILHRISTPMGYKSQANASDFVGTNKAALQAEMSQKLVQFEDKLRVLADLCDSRGVYLDITITAGAPLKSVLVKEAIKMKATHVLLDRHLRRDKKYYKEHLQCDVVAFLEKNQPERVRESSLFYNFDNPGLPFSRLNSTFSTDLSSRISTATSISCDGNSIPHPDTSPQREESRAPPLPAMEPRETMNFNHNRDLQDMGNLSPESDAQSVASSASHSGESSYIDLFMRSSPDGILPIWSSANENEPSPSRGESSTDQAVTNEESKSPPEDVVLSSNIKATTEPANADNNAPLTSYSSDPHRPSECLEKEIISVHPRRNFPQLNELMRAHDHQTAADSGKIGADSRLVHSQVQASLREEEVDPPENVVSVVDDNETKSKSAKPMVYAGDVLVKHQSQAPPLCSICKLRSMELGRTPRVYDWLELKSATNNFASENLIAEGGFSFVYRGTLPEGQTVAVKKLKTTTLQSDVQFVTEVEALSCAQHRNLVRLLGYGVGGTSDRLLVYEYVCNGSLDQHLSGHSGSVLQWPARHKIAIGAARGLRYLHEECRVGCIVHRDMRPNNILLTHDFEPMVGDFGLAKMNIDVDTPVETQVVGALGFLAPEYVECGQVTSKTDVYSFGIVLLQLISGSKAIDFKRPKDEISLVEWARQKLLHHRIHELVDERIAESLDVLELDMMVKAASLCIKKDPQARPGMSQVLRILEGDYYEFSNEAMQENAIVDTTPQALVWSHSREDLHQSASKLQMLQTSSKRVSTVPRSWRNWVRTT
ncbi:hypothetical protein GOP47_0027263 [Adiantum capillus-veneris]|nr:hypothetical protein GOP47_0027263 [Adiantum capillus-veneris]